MLAIHATAQTAAPQWQKIAPENEEFTVLMPRAPQIETEKKPFGQLTVTSISYIVPSEDGPLYMVVSVSGVGAFSAMMPEKDRLNSYAAGFWEGFFKAIREKGLKAEATRQRELRLNGHLGAAYSLTVGDITGTARAYSTSKKFYVTMVLNALEGDPSTERFLNSFTLVQAPGRPGLTTEFGPVIVPQRNTGNITVQSDEPPPPVPPARAPDTSRPISGGVLNGKAISLPKPVYPPQAREAGASGTVTVEILVNEDGNVIEARAVSGHTLLQQAAVEAALKARLSPTRLSGVLVKVKGLLVYNFVPN
jgi:TonB family protein